VCHKRSPINQRNLCKGLEESLHYTWGSTCHHITCLSGTDSLPSVWGVRQFSTLPINPHPTTTAATKSYYQNNLFLSPHFTMGGTHEEYNLGSCTQQYLGRAWLQPSPFRLHHSVFGNWVQ
jgi:hypothetical protein